MGGGEGGLLLEVLLLALVYLLMYLRTFSEIVRSRQVNRYLEQPLSDRRKLLSRIS